MTLGRFQELIRAAREATSELSVENDWMQQTLYFLSPAGTEYFARLQKHVVSLMNAEGPEGAAPLKP
jgi:hypothetical protein